MSLLLRMKKVVETFPPPVGRMLAHIPYRIRLGRAYADAWNRMAEFEALSAKHRRLWIADRIGSALEDVASRNSFYRDFWKSRGFDTGSFSEIGDIKRIPIIAKSDLRKVSLDDRSVREPGRILTNTGGSSGKPLDFYLDRHAFAREWAHMHAIWDRIGYVPTDTKLTFRGRNLGAEPVRYNAVYNEYLVNAYVPPDMQADAVKEIAQRVTVIHGYPSSIYEFVRYCAENRPDVLDSLRIELKGVLLASEYPAPVYRDLIEGELNTRSVSWYGHSEMAVLAYETDRSIYVPYQTYGYCEAIPDAEGHHHLVGTSYWNRVSPFIRYDTEDLIEPEFDRGMLVRFKIESGRMGEFITDANGARISLTALIFGRHHKLFGRAQFIQVRQSRPGHATLIITMAGDSPISEEQVRSGFEASNVAIEFDFELCGEPVRTPAGKVPLLVTAQSRK